MDPVKVSSTCIEEEPSTQGLEGYTLKEDCFKREKRVTYGYGVHDVYGCNKKKWNEKSRDEGGGL